MFGAREELDMLLEFIKSGDQPISLNNIVPSPEELLTSSKAGIITPSLVEKYGSMDIGTWRIENWGCTKDATAGKVIEDKAVPFERLMKAGVENLREAVSEGQDAGAVVLSFETNSHPNNAIGALSEKFANIRIHYAYDNEREGVCGWAVLLAGDVKGYREYDDCLTAIRLHIEPMHSESGSLLEALKGSDEDNN
jgi:hypothetical protein